MTPLFDQNDVLRRVQGGAKAQATPHQDAAERAILRLGDKHKYRGRYHKVFKRAALAFVDLEEYVEKSLEPHVINRGQYFLQTVEKLLGIQKR